MEHNNVRQVFHHVSKGDCTNLVFLSSTRMNHHIAEAQGPATHKLWHGFVTSLIFQNNDMNVFFLQVLASNATFLVVVIFILFSLERIAMYYLSGFSLRRVHNACAKAMNEHLSSARLATKLLNIEEKVLMKFILLLLIVE